MNRLGNCYASTNYVLSIYYSLTKQKTSEAKRFDVNECIGRTWVVTNIRTSGFSVFGVLELAHTAESAAKKKDMILILTRIINHYHFNIFVLQVL